MSRQYISSGSSFEERIGYSRAIVSDEWVFVSGCTGYDYATRKISPDIVEQTEQTFKNIQAALSDAGATMDEVVRVQYILTSRDEVSRCWPVFKNWLGAARPAATMTITGLLDEAMKIEIEVTARKGSAGTKTESGSV
ncbi:endoribonuclease L-PSP [Xylariales sp. PMI_506]|nr:endoribonuclease L-PSP [Xylariales sp. PMI_506]